MTALEMSGLLYANEKTTETCAVCWGCFGTCHLDPAADAQLTGALSSVFCMQNGEAEELHISHSVLRTSDTLAIKVSHHLNIPHHFKLDRRMLLLTLIVLIVPITECKHK